MVRGKNMLTTMTIVDDDDNAAAAADDYYDDCFCNYYCLHTVSNFSGCWSYEVEDFRGCANTNTELQVSMPHKSHLFSFG